MKKDHCQMCDTHDAVPGNPHGWCDFCENEFAGVLSRLACECGTCATPVTCTILKRCAAAGESIPKKLYKVPYEIKRQA